MFPPHALPVPKEVLLITDELLAPSDFLLHRFSASHLKDSVNSTCLLVSFSEDIGKWKTIAVKLNLNLAAYLNSGRMSYIDAKSHVIPVLGDTPEQPLQSLYHQIKSVLSSWSGKNILVVVDDLSSVEWAGIHVAEITRFARALSAICRQYNASLILRLHIVTPGEPDELFKNLKQLCSYHLDVFPLSSGRSGSVSGQIALHCGPSLSESPLRAVLRSTAILYRLTDSGVVFFDRGTGQGVL